MYRWEGVATSSLFGMDVRMYREPYHEDKSFVAAEKNIELDHYAFRYFKTEILMYQIMDVNWIQYIEERGDLGRISNIKIPTIKNENKSVL